MGKGGGMEQVQTIVIVDDNENVYKSLKLNFHQQGFPCLWATNTRETLAIIRDNPVAAVLMDLSLGGENGIEAMQEVFCLRPGLPVIIITGYGTFEAAVQAIKLGAFDFLPKPLEFDRLLGVVRNAIQVTPDPRKKGEEEREGEAGDTFLLTRHHTIRELCQKARRLAETDIPILITGESGTGKELLATLIHRHSRRHDQAFVRVNCSAFVDTLIDSELFGHERGSFTGATGTKSGLFEQANRGTLHLDEIGDMSLATQAKILRVLESGVLRRIGGDRDIPVDVRIIASTNKNLDELIEQGGFREDLFYRLNAVLLYVPPLRDREDDILLLAHRFLNEFYPGQGRRFTPDTEDMLRRYSWPGNVRELRNVVKVAAVVSTGGEIDTVSLPDQIRLGTRAAGAKNASIRLDNTEADLIRRVLHDAKGNKKRASERLGISRRTLYNKLERYGID
jgi:DNA-binding NtrC family response regulator